MDRYSEFRGPRQLPRAYRAMFENDPHPLGSVDRAIWDSMVRLTPETADFLYREFTRPGVAYTPGSRPGLEQIVARLQLAQRPEEDRVARIAEFTSGMAPEAPVPIDRMKFGGTEEEIVARGSDWCPDVARVACALLQVAGVPARIVILENTSEAYTGHTIVEAWRRGRWGAVDPVSDIIYRTNDAAPATTWDLVSHPELIDAHPRAGRTPEAQRGQFRWAAIANYSLGPVSAADYGIGSINQYYRLILTMSDQGWPGGLRWLFGEDHSHEVAR
jgi:transglutaminase-like putative cysteine protease